MFRVLSCLATEHDWRLVLVAGFVCFLASLTAISLFNRARATAGRTRAIWIVAGGRRGRMRDLGNAFRRHAGV
jgi:NO-binding membrane sensor protein with MHYT domain